MGRSHNPDYQKTGFRIIRRALHLLVGVMLLLTCFLAWPLFATSLPDLNISPSIRSSALLAAANTASPTPTLTATPSPLPPTPSSTLVPTIALLPNTTNLPALEQGLTVLAINEAGKSHLFLFRPSGNPGGQYFTRLTAGSWDDITPTLSPDGAKLAFASNRDGQWDLYAMDMLTGEVTRLTTTPEWDASPTWSPDGLWLAYETVDPAGLNGLEVNILSVGSQDRPISLSADPAADYAPAWSPQGRKLAFVSNRSGKDEIWLADLDLVEDRFQNLESVSAFREDHPTWSADGAHLAWSAVSEDGMESVYSIDFSQPDPRPTYEADGSWPAWSPDGQALLTSVRTPNKTYLTAYHLASDGLVLPALALPGALEGITWTRGAIPAVLPAGWQEAAAQENGPLWVPALSSNPDIPNGRQQVVPLPDVAAANPMLHDLVDESFNALRNRVSVEAGWDFLAGLDNAFVPLTVPLGPGTGEDWLYTGRAFTVNPVTINAGWMVAVREDFGGRTYWRLYIRTRNQDGTQGRPLRQQPWDFSLRYGGDPRFYEQGGGLSQQIPSGYWLDFTELAQAYGWERLPALSTWRTAFSTSRFNEYVHTDGLDWLGAMREIYPEAALATATPIPPPTETPTPTLRPTRTPVPTRTFTATPTATNTATPAASPTPQAALP